MQNIVDNRLDSINVPSLSKKEGSDIFSPAKSLVEVSPDKYRQITEEESEEPNKSF